MYYEVRISKKGIRRFIVLDDYIDPLTGKKKRASVAYYHDTVRARKEAERELEDKIDELIESSGRKYNSKKITTFGELKNSWLDNWQAGVKRTTIEREKLVLRRLNEVISDDVLLINITPLLIKGALLEYERKYQTSYSTLQHIKSTFNKIFDFGVLYGVVLISPTKVIRLQATPAQRKAERDRREAKFLEPPELVAFFAEMKQSRNKNYFDLCIFLLLTGLRIGEAGALTLDDFDFEKRTVDISKSLQSRDLKVDDFYLDTTKTPNSERVVLMPQAAIDAVKRVIERNAAFDKHMSLNPAKSFRHCQFIFRTEYGAPITSHSFRAVLSRAEKRLKNECPKRYGFEWKRHVVPHSFRHMQITYLQSGDAGNVVGIKEIMGRVGHLNVETTMVYTHRTKIEQEKSVDVLNQLAQKLGLG
ncbi:tyrosine-type recombinase/integrase [Lactococcus fujiensis]|uniref:Tyr recombinase domain-containing protein n=1 Tax=Lactococcus fujiensis JCM 16395 TaxID=1291764 RepID=A0A2A5RJC9_9LACT|nr:site-specific integrase [Lactococcus fujiensis]PCR99202.1 hypothetical protein RT41_GL000393 [Lactococcus fujiensis JCM 16395]